MVRIPEQQQIYSVKKLASEMRNLLEASYRQIWIEGEISNLASPASGHLYFSLKEGQSIIRCAFFRNRQKASTASIKDGMQVLVNGDVSIYEARGDLQLIVTYLEPSGEGALRRAFEQLKAKLAAVGLFEESRKKPLPTLPKTIGVITSETGAALQDILITLRRRAPYLKVIIYPTLVQGEGAPENICSAIELAEKRQEVDALLLARGGGSLEDLQAFNEETVAMALSRLSVPVVTGIGHETDFTICDFIADKRAATPTAAAETIAPNHDEMHRMFLHYVRQMESQAKYALMALRQQTDTLQTRLRHPSSRLAEASLVESRLRQRMIYAIQNTLQDHKYASQELKSRLSSSSPANRLQICSKDRIYFSERMVRAAKNRIIHYQQSNNLLRNSLKAFSPRHTLERGYSILQNKNGTVVSQTKVAKKESQLRATLSDGQIELQVISE